MNRRKHYLVVDEPVYSDGELPGVGSAALALNTTLVQGKGFLMDSCAFIDYINNNLSILSVH